MCLFSFLNGNAQESTQFYWFVFLIKIMTANRVEYEHIDNKSPVVIESVYDNPVFNELDQVN